MLAQIEAYNEGNPLPAAVDVYPYTAVSTKLRAFIPKDLLQDGIAAVADKVKSPENVQRIADFIVEKDYHLDQMLIISDEFAHFYNRTVAVIAEENGWTLAEAISQLLQASTETWVVYHCIDQKDIDTAILWPTAMICTDSWSYPINAPKTIGQPHPRSYGAFTTYLERYVIDKQWLSWEEAIHKVSHLPAEFFKLKGRGSIEPGYFADLVLLNPDRVHANASYLAPRQLSDGVEHVWVNGQRVIANREMQPICPGHILRSTV